MNLERRTHTDPQTISPKYGGFNIDVHAVVPMKKIFVSVYPFGLIDPKPRDALEKSSYSIAYNPHQRKLKPEETAQLAVDCDVVIAGTETLTPLINASNTLKFISRVGIGLDSVPLNLCRDKSIAVSYTPDAVTPAVSELTVGLMISQLRFVGSVHSDMKRGKWNRKIGRRISGCSIGIVGCGRVGTRLIRLLAPFKPNLIRICDIVDKTVVVQSLKSELGLNIVQTDFNSLFQSSDIITLHLPLTKQSKNLITLPVLKTAKPDALFINTARGGLVNENDLYTALKAGMIGQAAIDVFGKEPYAGKLCELPNVVTTPHIGSCSRDCRSAMEWQAAEDALYFLETGNQRRPVPEDEYANDLHQ